MKIYSLIIAVILVGVFYFPLKTQNFDIHWRSGTNFPLPLSEINAVTCNNKIYVVGGKIITSKTDYNKNENVDFTYEYNSKSNEWTKKSNMPFKDYDVALVEINNKIYAIGSKTALYNPDLDKWELRKPLEDGKAHLEAAVVDGKIYIFGFFECTRPNKTMRYDPETDTWNEMSPIPFARIAPTVAVVNSKIYVMGGIGVKENGNVEFSKQSQRIDVYDPKQNTWENIGNLPDSIWGAEGAIVKYGHIILINIRSNKNDFKNNAYAYNAKSKSWQIVKTELPHKYNEFGVTLLNDEIYLVGGHDSESNQHKDVYIGKIILKNNHD